MLPSGSVARSAVISGGMPTGGLSAVWCITNGIGGNWSFYLMVAAAPVAVIVGLGLRAAVSRSSVFVP